MGFFTFSKKSEHDDASWKENGRPFASGGGGESGFKSLRSRLQVYAKKLDSKDRDSTSPMFSQPVSVAQTLSPPIATPIAARHLKLKLSSSSPALNAARPQTRPDRAKSANTSPTSRNSIHAADSDMRPSSSRSRALGTKASSSSLAAAPPSQKQSDNITTTLAQRLNELAAANSEGLLDDDEYRLLRQDLFERFAGNTVVPVETPVVPLAASQASRSSVRFSGTTNKRQSIDSARLSISTSSNFVVDKHPTPSVHSRSSTMTSGVASLFRRATGRQPSRDYSDSSSIFSSTSAVPSESASHLRRLSKKKSDSSLGTDRGDAVSVSSRRTNNLSSPTEPSAAAPSIRSVRRLPTPPSSFPTKLPGVESRYAGMGPDPEASNTDVKNSESVQSIRGEIAAVEAEARRLMDAFNGLELTTLTKRKRTSAMSPRDSAATLIPGDARSVHSNRHSRKATGSEPDDATSIRSATSAGTSASMTSRRGARGTTLKPGAPLHASSFVSSSSSLRISTTLDRKNSVSSMGSSSRLGIGVNGTGTETGMGTGTRTNGGLVVPPVPPLPLGMSLGQLGSTPSLSRSSSHLPMGVLHENEAVVTIDLDEEREFGIEMEELRRRREEVAARYEARLEYLRAKLKGAELHEKLLAK